ncbi:nucleoside kinase [Eubacteriales bacterium OttesenSCG-928-N13]|nr:nucleoside kinase [Eubacteriales bacterium OttesenSCG-928-N13]
MNITLNNRAITYDVGDSFLDIVNRTYPSDARRILGIRMGGKTLPLSARPQEGYDVTTLDYGSEEGFRIYERSLRFVFLLAMHQLYPDKHVRIENSTSSGLLARLVDAKMDEHMVEMIEQRMRDIVLQDLPFTKRVISRNEAIKLFDAQGYDDKVKLLKYRPFDHFQLYSLDGLLEYFYGEMAPSTGYVSVFKLNLYLPGLEILLPDPKDPSVPAPHEDHPQLLRTFAESQRWGTILGCANAADLNGMVAKRTLREFIRVNEALHEKSISGIADKFVSSGAQLILVAGPSSSGKTTFTHRLSILLRVQGLKPMKLSLDDYYIDRDKIPLDENGELDLERLDTLDVKLFNEHLVKLLQGEPIDAPIFDFLTGTRLQKTHRMQLEPGQPVLVEGIHGLNPALTMQVPREQKFMIYISALTTLNLDDHNRIRTTDVRLLRRLVRDHQFRGTHPEETMSMWNSVRRGEQEYIFPHQERADVMFNSTLVYELAILKKYAYPLLLNIKEDSPFYTRARRLVKFLNYIMTAEVEDEIPLNSILREFVGGCTFYREED